LHALGRCGFNGPIASHQSGRQRGFPNKRIFQTGQQNRKSVFLFKYRTCSKSVTVVSHCDWLPLLCILLRPVGWLVGSTASRWRVIFQLDKEQKRYFCIYDYFLSVRLFPAFGARGNCTCWAVCVVILRRSKSKHPPNTLSSPTGGIPPIRTRHVPACLPSCLFRYQFLVLFEGPTLPLVLLRTNGPGRCHFAQLPTSTKKPFLM
jgi:hypothetical protein